MAFIGAKPTNVPLTSADIQDNIITSAKIVDGTIATADISDGAVTSVKTTGVGGTNTPAFSAYLSGNQSLSDNTFTKLNFNTEEYDSGSVFDTSNNRFTPAVVGKYMISAGASMDGNQSGNLDKTKLSIYKNGSAIRVVEPDFRANPVRIANPTFSYLINVTSTSDYFEIFAYISGSVSGSGLFIQGGATYTYFNGYKIIE